MVALGERNEEVRERFFTVNLSYSLNFEPYEYVNMEIRNISNIKFKNNLDYLFPKVTSRIHVV